VPEPRADAEAALIRTRVVKRHPLPADRSIRITQRVLRLVRAWTAPMAQSRRPASLLALVCWSRSVAGAGPIDAG